MSRLKPRPTKLMQGAEPRERSVKRAGPSQETLDEFRWNSRKQKARPPATVIGIHEGRKNEGSAKKPPKGKFVRGVFFPALTGWANFCHASGVGPGMHRLRKHAGVVRLPGRPDEGSAKNPPKGKCVEDVLLMSRLKPRTTKLPKPKGKFVEDVLFMSRLNPRPTKLPNMSRLGFTKGLWVNSAGIHEKRVSATLLANIVQDTKRALDALSASICGGHSMLCPYG
jgi:hypothetical protein